MTSKFTATVSQITLTHRIHSQGQASLWFVRCCPGNHSDAVDNRADGETEGTACASVGNGGQVGLRVKLDSLQTETESLAVTAHKGQERPCFSASVFLHRWRAALRDSYAQRCGAAIATVELLEKWGGGKREKNPFKLETRRLKLLRGVFLALCEETTSERRNSRVSFVVSRGRVLPV